MRGVGGCLGGGLRLWMGASPRRSRLFRPGPAEPIGGGGAHGWDVASAAVVSGLECERLTIGTTERAVIGRQDPGIPSLFSPERVLLTYLPPERDLRARVLLPTTTSLSTGQLGAAAWLHTGREGFFPPVNVRGGCEEPGAEEYAGIRPVPLAPLSCSSAFRLLLLLRSPPPLRTGPWSDRRAGDRTNSPRGSEPGGGGGHGHTPTGASWVPTPGLPYLSVWESLGDPCSSPRRSSRTVPHVNTRSPLARRRAEWGWGRSRAPPSRLGAPQPRSRLPATWWNSTEEGGRGNTCKNRPHALDHLLDLGTEYAEGGLGIRGGCCRRMERCSRGWWAPDFGPLYISSS